MSTKQSQRLMHLLAGAATSVTMIHAAHAQCAFEWEGGYGRGGTYTETSAVYASVVHDDGSGPATYFAGEFSFLDGMWSPTGLVRYRDGYGEAVVDGVLATQWFGTGVRALTVWDEDGPGPQPPVLMLGGANWAGVSEGRVAQWNGTSFTELPALAWTGNLGPGVQAMAAFDSDNDNVDELYVAGDLYSNDFTGGIARWNPSLFRWDSVGFTGVSGWGMPRALHVHNDGSGSALYLAGQFPAGILGIPGTDNIARWDGVSWTSVGGGLPGEFNSVGTLATLDPDGNGPSSSLLIAITNTALFAWDGATWASFAYPGTNSCIPPNGAAIVEDAPGQFALYFGSVQCAAGNSMLYRFDGTSLAPVAGSEVQNKVNNFNNFFTHVCAADIGSGTQIIGSGVLFAPETMSENFLAWTGSHWNDAGTPHGQQRRPHYPYDMVVADINGTGSPLLVAAGAAAVNRPDWPIVGAYDGTDWVALDGPGTPTGSTRFAASVAAASDGALYAAFRDGASSDSAILYVSRRTPIGWDRLNPAGSGFPAGNFLPDDVQLLMADVGGDDQLFIYGAFTTADGNPIAGIARWNGTAWASLGSGLTASTTPDAFRANAVAFDDGSGQKIFVAGTFSAAGGVSTPQGVATWDGVAWSNASAGLGAVASSESYRFFVSGNAIFAMKRGGFSGDTVYRWNGSLWNPVSTLPAGLTFGSPIPIGNADLGDGEQQFFNEDFVGLWSFDPQTNAWEDRTPLSGTIIGQSSKLIRFDVNNQLSYFLSGTFDHVEGEMVGGNIFIDATAGLSTTGTVGIARLFCPEPLGQQCPSCAADYDGNGGVDGGDLAAFFADFEAGENCADVDHNGGVDGGDLAFFFFVFEQGGC